MNPIWTLAPASAVLGALMMWTYRRTADREAIGVAIDRIQAYLLEFWLFVDEPALVWKSWKGLLTANARLYRLLLKPLLILSIPAAPLYFLFDAQYGTAPLPVGQAALVTLGMRSAVEPITPIPELTAPDGIAVESPAVRVFSERQVSWRIRPLRPVSGELAWMLGGQKLEKSVVAGAGFRIHSSRRSRSLLDLVRYPTESPLAAGPVDWIEVSYPAVGTSWLGLEAHWLIWFVVFSLAGARAQVQFFTGG